jgi:hypothetical protein
MRAMEHRPSLIAATLPEHYDTTFVDNDRELAKLAPGLAVLAVYWQRRLRLIVVRTGTPAGTLAGYANPRARCLTYSAAVSAMISKSQTVRTR